MQSSCGRFCLLQKQKTNKKTQHFNFVCVLFKKLHPVLQRSCSVPTLRKPSHQWTKPSAPLNKLVGDEMVKAINQQQFQASLCTLRRALRGALVSSSCTDNLTNPDPSFLPPLNRRTPPSLPKKSCKKIEKHSPGLLPSLQ